MTGATVCPASGKVNFAPSFMGIFTPSNFRRKCNQSRTPANAAAPHRNYGAPSRRMTLPECPRAGLSGAPSAVERAVESVSSMSAATARPKITLQR